MHNMGGFPNVAYSFHLSTTKPISQKLLERRDSASQPILDALGPPCTNPISHRQQSSPLEEEEKDNSRLWLQIGAVLSVLAFLFVYSASDLQLATGGGIKVKAGSRGGNPPLHQPVVLYQSARWFRVISRP
eukprot:1712903-Pyramimonas_sp.AAC.2